MRKQIHKDNARRAARTARKLQRRREALSGNLTARTTELDTLILAAKQATQKGS